MTIQNPIALAEDVLIIPAQDLEDQVRARTDCGPDEFAVSRPGARSASRIVDARTADLLKLFEKPRRIVDGVILFSFRHGLDPEQVLEAAHPVFQKLLAGGFLVGDGTEEEVFRPERLVGRRFQSMDVVDLVAALEDTAVYLVCAEDGRPAALKMQVSEGEAIAGNLRNEAAILRHLKGHCAPRLLGEGEVEGRFYLQLEWCEGVHPEVVAAELRGQPRSAARLQELCRAITGAYERLHELGVLHADVHPHNILVDRHGAVRLIDFGLACRCDGGEGHPTVGGVPFFFEPEYAEAMLSNSAPPRPSAAAEQYSLAAVLYNLVTGAHYLDFHLGREEMLRQIVEEPPLSFKERGRTSWPRWEAVLRRALAKAPGERFPSMAAFREALAGVPVEEEKKSSRARRSSSRSLANAVEPIVHAASLDGEWLSSGLDRPPTASINFGAAGIAYALYRIGCLRDDPALLSAADVWAGRAAAEVGDDRGFYNEEIEITREMVGERSPYHNPSGVFAVQALIARAMASPLSQVRALEHFFAACDRPPGGIDLTLGRSGVVLACALLLDTLPGDGSLRREPLIEFGDRALAETTSEIVAMAPIGDAELDNLGIAHGWAGLIYAALQWSRAAGSPPPSWTEVRLRELAALAQPSGRGLRWPWTLRRHAGGRPAYMPGWCNGSSGHVFLWNLAARLFDEPRYRELASGVAWDVWEAEGRSASLCCGLAGRAYALLNMYKHSGETAWLRRARDLAQLGVEDGYFEPDYPHSLYKGQLGLAVLAADLERPDEAAQPFFEEEGWPTAPGS